uniref:Protein Spindly-A n=1 Tax=Lygus hesperus TaxID=30085 RepID=A0A0A9WAR7_LYGHE
MDPQAMEETLLQEVHRLKLALDKEVALGLDCQAENERLHAEISELKSKLDAVKISQNDEIRCLKDKIINLTNEYETEKLSCDERLSEMEAKLKNTKIEKPPAGIDENEYEKALNGLMNEKQLRVDLEQKYSSLKEEMCHMEIELEQKLKETVQHYEETREALEVKKENLTEALAALKEAQEEKALLTAEVDILKAGPVDNLDRGNSLFKEVEDNRKKLVAAYNALKSKYMVLKNIVAVKNQEINRLKSQVASLKSQDLGLDRIMEKSNSALCQSMKKRILELENMVYLMEKWKESPQIVTITENECDNLQWIHHIVNQARNETRKAIADYQKLSSDQMEKAVVIRKTELEIMNLKSEMVQKDGKIEKLEMEVANLKSEMKENASQSKPHPEDSVLSVRNTNKTVRFADASLEETMCNVTNN